MRIEEIVVSDDTPATPVGDGQGLANPPVATNVEGGATTDVTDPAALTTEPIDKEMQVSIDEATLNKDLEEVEGEYGPPAEQIDEAGEALEEARDVEADAHETIVALESYFLITKQILDNKSYSIESLELIRTGVEPFLKNGKFVTMAMEGREGASIELQHQLVLEGIKESIKSALHSVHTANSASADNIKMIFTSIESDVKRYSAGLQKAVEKFDAFIKENPKEELHLDLHILQNFFNLTAKQVSELVPFIKSDEKFDAYVLTQFSTSCEKQLEEAAKIIGSEKTFSGVVDKISKLKHPIETFDRKRLTSAKGLFGGAVYDGVLLGGYFAHIHHLRLGGFKQEKFDKLSRLEQLSSSASVAISQHTGHAKFAAYTATHPASFTVAGALSPVLKVTPAQIKSVADTAAAYLKNVEFFLQVLKNTSRTHDQVLEKFGKFEAPDVSRKQADQIYDFLKNLEGGVTGTCRNEVTRALKAVFYSIALINRASFVNK
jgi:hypothetical protein